MTTDLNKILPENPFWDFSLKFYGQKEVEPALLHLQQQYAFNVNIVLYFFWYANVNQGGLTQKKIRHLLTAIAPWHYKVVLPLRRLRKTLNRDHAFYHMILEEEINAEHIEQTLIYEEVWIMEKKERSPTRKVADICRSLMCYCQILQVKVDEQMTTTINTLFESLFPSLDISEFALITSDRLQNHPKMTKVTGTQVWMDL